MTKLKNAHLSETLPEKFLIPLGILANDMQHQ